MKILNNLVKLILILIAVISCTDYNIDDTGLSLTVEDKTMLEYFEQDSYNWDSLRVMARHTNLESMFNGTSKYGSNITFLGITNHSIRRYLLTNGYERVTDVPIEEGKELILSSVINSKIMLEDFVRGTAPTDTGTSIIGEGGKVYKTLSGKELWIYTFRPPYAGVPDKGPLTVSIISSPNKTNPVDKHTSIQVASSNILTKTGVVHSLDYNFTMFQ